MEPHLGVVQLVKHRWRTCIHAAGSLPAKLLLAFLLGKGRYAKARSVEEGEAYILRTRTLRDEYFAIACVKLPCGTCAFVNRLRNLDLLGRLLYNT